MEQQIADRFEHAQRKGRDFKNQIQRDRSDRKWVEFEPYNDWQSQTLRLLKSVFGPENDYARNFESATTNGSFPTAQATNVERGMGVLNGAAEEIARGWAWQYPERLRGEVFEDLLEAAEQLLRDGWVDAAAVTAGGALEVHIKKLAEKHGVPIGKVSIMNQALWKEKGVYTQPEWRSVDSWYDLRNAAAHQDDDSPRTVPQVELMIAGVRDFIIRHPA